MSVEFDPGVYVGVDDPKARKRRPARVNIEAYLRNVARAWEKVLEQLTRLPTVAERRALVLRNVKLSTTKKLGTIRSFSLPTLITCIMSPFCAEWCYAMKGSYMYSEGNAETRLWNLLASFTPEFPVVLARKMQRYRIVRLHDSGDFYVVPLTLQRMRALLGVTPEMLEELIGVKVERLKPHEYIEKIAKAVEMAPQTRVYAYTRAWLYPQHWEWIERLLLPKPNVVIWLSVDRSMTQEQIERAEEIAARWPNVGLAYTALEHPEAYPCPPKARCDVCLYCPLMKGKRVYFPLR